jgi:hypothetical protein
MKPSQGIWLIENTEVRTISEMVIKCFTFSPGTLFPLRHRAVSEAYTVRADEIKQSKKGHPRFCGRSLFAGFIRRPLQSLPKKRRRRACRDDRTLPLGRLEKVLSDQSNRTLYMVIGETFGLLMGRVTLFSSCESATFRCCDWSGLSCMRKKHILT